jgi:hypothetical protein
MKTKANTWGLYLSIAVLLVTGAYGFGVVFGYDWLLAIFGVMAFACFWWRYGPAPAVLDAVQLGGGLGIAPSVPPSAPGPVIRAIWETVLAFREGELWLLIRLYAWIYGALLLLNLYLYGQAEGFRSWAVLVSFMTASSVARLFGTFVYQYFLWAVLLFGVIVWGPEHPYPWGALAAVHCWCAYHKLGAFKPIEAATSVDWMGTMTRARRLKQEAEREAERAEQAAREARWAEEQKEQEREMAALRAELRARTGKPPTEQDVAAEMLRRLLAQIPASWA